MIDVILKGNQRGGAKNLALHLLKEENEHCEVHEIRGFASDNLVSALNEAYAVSRGTRCKQFLFSVSFNPPPQENVGVEAFENAIDSVEQRLGLDGQPRAIVFHEKEGRRHAHEVWSRVDTEEMKAVQLSFSHKKLQSVSRELYLEHGWTMPPGLANSKERNPKNFTLEEWQQAKRIGKDPRAIKTAIQDAWAISDSGAAFAHALEERGYKIARGDRAGIVAVDYDGEVYSVPRYAGVKIKQVRSRIGDEKTLPSVAEVKERIAQDMLPAMERLKGELDTQGQTRREEFDRRRKALVEGQRAARQDLNDKIERRHIEESKVRQARFRTGIKGLWDRLRGEHKRIRQQNEQEAEIARNRDRTEKDALVSGQLAQRRALRQHNMKLTGREVEQKQDIQRDIARYADLKKMALRKQREEASQPVQRKRERKRTRQQGPDIGF